MSLQLREVVPGRDPRRLAHLVNKWPRSNVAQAGPMWNERAIITNASGPCSNILYRTWRTFCSGVIPSPTRILYQTMADCNGAKQFPSLSTSWPSSVKSQLTPNPIMRAALKAARHLTCEASFRRSAQTRKARNPLTCRLGKKRCLR